MERATVAAGDGLVREPDERLAPVNGIELAYEELGDPAGEPLVLIMGLATQMIFWDVELCELLGDRGYRVIRFDNRDIGHSTKIDAAGVPNDAAMILGYGRPAYRLADMAADTVGLLDHLGIERAHVVGASMGGMIAQQVAIDHPGRTLSLCSIMSATGNRRYRFPSWRAFASLMAKPASSREGYIDQAVMTFKVIGSPAYPMDEPRFRALCGLSYDRSFHPAGIARQLHAINCSGNRAARLRRLDLPALIVHGTADPLVRPVAGRATAASIRGAKLWLIEGMGHDLPAALHADFAREIDANARRLGGVG
jgi:pimeloyl-ACP methyl ester carboxylesterase